MRKDPNPQFIAIMSIVRAEFDLALSRIHGRLKGEMPEGVEDSPLAQAALAAFPGAEIVHVTETMPDGGAAVSYDREQTGAAAMEALTGFEGIVMADPRDAAVAATPMARVPEHGVVVSAVRESMGHAVDCKALGDIVGAHHDAIAGLPPELREGLRREVEAHAIVLADRQRLREATMDEGRGVALGGASALRAWFPTLSPERRKLFPKGSSEVAELNEIAAKATPAAATAA